MPKKIIPAIIIIQVLFFIVFIFYKSFGSIPGYELLDQIAVADRIFMGMDLYPSSNSQELWGVSVYFPGIAFLTSGLMQIIPSSSIVIVMCCLAFITTFLVIFIQKYIVYSIYKDYNSRNFWPVMLILTLTLSYHWLSYATAFKADGLAYLIGAICVLTNDRFKENTRLAFFLGIITGSALLFKQQYIAFIIGYLFYFIITRHKEDYNFTAGILLSLILTTWYIFTDQSMFFWTVTITSDDGFLSFDEWLKLQLRVGMIGLIALLGLYLLHHLKRLNLNTIKLSFLMLSSTKKPFFWIIIASFGSAFLSSWLNGGNSGNTGFAIFLLSPLFLIIFENTNSKILAAVSLILVILHAPSLAKLDEKIEQIYNFKNEAEHVLNNECSGLVIGSELYYAVRDNYLGCNYQNYWTHALRNNSKKEDEFRALILDKNNKIFVVENIPITKAVILTQQDIDLVFENNIGLIAVRK